MKISGPRGSKFELSARKISSHIIRDKFYQLMEDGKSVDLLVMEMRKQVKD